LDGAGLSDEVAPDGAGSIREAGEHARPAVLLVGDATDNATPLKRRSAFHLLVL